MPKFIPEEKIAEIRDAADIVDFISDTVILKKTGRNFIGLCPFHAEKTPSFTVSPEKQIFHCFGCGEGGNVFTFLMKSEGLAFPEALKKVAARCGIQMPARTIGGDRGKNSGERERLLAVNRLALDFFRQNLAHADRSRRARAYLLRRGIDAEAMDRFGVGYAPPGWENLANYLVRRKVAARWGAMCGLLVARKERDGYYDRFRDRIMLPIFDLSGQVVAFGGRVMDDSVPKYLNSPETPVFSKGRTLFNLHRARSKCRQADSVLIVEGYFDLISLVQKGIENVVATLGTALTGDHVQRLKGCTRNMVLVFDGDAAGLQAARRSYAVFANRGVNAKVVVLPAGHDPDSYVRQFGRDGFLRKVETAEGIVTFLIDAAIRRHGDSIAGRVRAVDELMPVLAAIDDRVARSLYLRELAERVGVPEADILQRLRRTPAGKVVGKGGVAGATADGRPAAGWVGSLRIERQIVAMMLHFPEIIPEIRRRGLLDRFQSETLQQAGRLVMESDAPLAARIGELSPDRADEGVLKVLTSLAVADEKWDHNACLRLMDQFDASCRRQQDDLLKQIAAAEERGDQELLFKLLKDRQTQAGGGTT